MHEAHGNNSCHLLSCKCMTLLPLELICGNILLQSYVLPISGPQAVNRTGSSSSYPYTVQSSAISGRTCCSATSSKICCWFAFNLLICFWNMQLKNWKYFSWLRILDMMMLFIFLNFSMVFYCSAGCAAL